MRLDRPGFGGEALSKAIEFSVEIRPWIDSVADLDLHRVVGESDELVGGHPGNRNQERRRDLLRARALVELVKSFGGQARG